MCHNGAFAVWFLHSKKGGKIQTGLNCGDDSLSKVWLWLAYSSHHIFKSNYYSEYVSCFHLSFLKSTRIYRLYSITSNNFKVFGLYSCLKNWKCHVKTALSQVKDIAGIVLNNEIGFVYEKDTHDNDYIILKLGSPLQFNENVQPACLPSSSSFLGLDSTKTSCFTSGWGKLNFSKL